MMVILPPTTWKQDDFWVVYLPLYELKDPSPQDPRGGQKKYTRYHTSTLAHAPAPTGTHDTTTINHHHTP